METGPFFNTFANFQISAVINVDHIFNETAATVNPPKYGWNLRLKMGKWPPLEMRPHSKKEHRPLKERFNPPTFPMGPLDVRSSP